MRRQYQRRNETLPDAHTVFRTARPLATHAALFEAVSYCKPLLATVSARFLRGHPVKRLLARFRCDRLSDKEGGDDDGRGGDQHEFK